TLERIMQAEWWREAMRTPKARTTERYPALPRIRLVRRRFRAARPISCTWRISPKWRWPAAVRLHRVCDRRLPG
ncbi:hypothetical protein, partial [Mycobacterium sp.]|uniref:hypothetical protein n=1 Tax=Mycobacterium sp. TaxID=1785 RepID=UPI002D7EE818